MRKLGGMTWLLSASLGVGLAMGCSSSDSPSSSPDGGGAAATGGGGKAAPVGGGGGAAATAGTGTCDPPKCFTDLIAASCGMVPDGACTDQTTQSMTGILINTCFDSGIKQSLNIMFPSSGSLKLYKKDGTVCLQAEGPIAGGTNLTLTFKDSKGAVVGTMTSGLDEVITYQCTGGAAVKVDSKKCEMMGMGDECKMGTCAAP